MPTMMTMRFLSLIVVVVVAIVATVESAPATQDFVPPLMPEEYSLSFEETYEAYFYNTSEVFASQRTVGTQYWSLSNLAQRAIVSSGVGGVSNGGASASAVVNSLTVTNFTDPDWDQGSLVVDLVGQKCSYFPNEGGTAYQGYDFYQNFVLGAIMAGIPVEQTNVSDWIFEGVSYGPVHIWAGTPPTGIPGRVLTYTIVFSQDSNYLLSYQVNGTEDLVDESTGEAVYVSMRSVNMRFDYANATLPWPEDFFDVIQACPYPQSPLTATEKSGSDPFPKEETMIASGAASRTTWVTRVAAAFWFLLTVS